MRIVTQFNASLPAHTRGGAEILRAVVPSGRDHTGRFAATTLAEIAVRILGVGFIVVSTGVFALVFLAVYGGLPLVFA